MCRRPHLAGQLARQMQIFGHNVQRPASAKLAAEHRPWNIIEGTTGSGADRDDLRQGVEVDAGFGTDEEPFERSHKVGIAEILRHQLGNTTCTCLSYIKDIPPHALQERSVGGKGGPITADHDGHPWWTTADWRIQCLDATCLADLG